jgi:hypothetical protein
MTGIPDVGALYEVLNPRGYRGHSRGAQFEGLLEPDAERRALARGDIRVLQRVTPSVRPGTFTLPQGWTNQYEEVH